VPSGFKFFCSANEQRSVICAKSFEKRGRRIVADWFLLSNVLFATALMPLHAADTAFLGKDSCSSSGCHGGAGPTQNQSLIWARQDPHSRASATLTSARSKRIAQVLKIPDATKDRTCTACHSPWQGLAADLLPAGATNFNVHAEAVSCETCHGPATQWIRSHTRPDLTRAQKEVDGLRDLTQIYNRANVCVACHQVLQPGLIAAGHPELLFELDGQTSAMPRHWAEKDKYFRAKGWLTGQAAALREVTAQVIEQRKAGSVAPQTFNQWQSLLWLAGRTWPERTIATITTNAVANADELNTLHRAADEVALQSAAQNLELPERLTIFRSLLRAASEFENVEKGDLLWATRAERHALALDRLSRSIDREISKSWEPSLPAVFELVQSRPDFDGKKYAEHVSQIEKTLSRFEF
jgi:RNase P subunit RPR2